MTMPTYTIIYGGQKHVEAVTETQAYQKFWDWLITEAEGGNVGLIVDQDSTEMEVIDLGAGGLVVCDACNRDYSASDESGGIMIGSEAYGPCCARKELQEAITMYGQMESWPTCAKVDRCPPGMSFRAWMLSLRPQ